MNTEPPRPPVPPSPSPGLAAGAVERQFRDAQIRARRHWFADGLAEVVVGSVFVVLGLYFAATGGLAPLEAAAGRGATLLAQLVLPALVVAAGLSGRRLIRRAKERLVYPRAGFVSYPTTRRRRWLPGVLGAVVAVLLTALVRRAPALEAWVPALEGLVLGAGFVALARFTGVGRFHVQGLLAAIVGIVVSWLALPSAAGGAAFFGSCGLALLVAGGLAFRRFLRDAPPAEES